MSDISTRPTGTLSYNEKAKCTTVSDCRAVETASTRLCSFQKPVQPVSKKIVQLPETSTNEALCSLWLLTNWGLEINWLILLVFVDFVLTFVRLFDCRLSVKFLRLSTDCFTPHLRRGPLIKGGGGDNSHWALSRHLLDLRSNNRTQANTKSAQT